MTTAEIESDTSQAPHTTWARFVDPDLFHATMEITVIHGDGLTLLTLDTDDDHLGISIPRDEVYRICEQILADRDRVGVFLGAAPHLSIPNHTDTTS